MKPFTKFDWQADEEEEWDDLRPETGVDDRSNLRWLGWLMGLIIIAAVAGAAVFLLNRRVYEAVTLTEKEVLATHELLLGAVEDDDYELFTSLLSERPRAWFELQPKLLRSRLFWGRTALSLEPGVMGTATESVLTVDLNSELRQAEVAQTRPFLVATAGGISNTVFLERTFLYERSDLGWHLAPLEDDAAFWDGWERWEGDVLTLIYPGRDEEIGRRLASELDDLISALCADQALDCPTEFRFELKLDRNEQALVRLSEDYDTVRILVRQGKGTLTLPAPSVVGRPMDEAGYQALAQGYAAWLGAVFVNDFASEQPGEGLATIETLLAEHDLQLPPEPKPLMPALSSAALPDGGIRPPHDILMLCTGGNQQRFLRFKVAEAEWAEELLFKAETPGVGNSFPQPNFHRLPDYSGVLVTFAEGQDEDITWQTYLWRDGQKQLWLEHEELPHFWSPRFFDIGNPPQESMNGYYYSIENNRAMIDSWWLDVEACQEGSCRRTESDGAPLWSPDGGRTLLTVMAPFDQPQLHLGDHLGRSLQNLGSGLPVSWVDEETYVYLHQQIPGVTDPTQRGIWKELVLGKIGSEDKQVLIDATDLKTGIAKERTSYQLGIVTAVPYKDGWLVAVRELGSDFKTGSYLFFFQPQTGELTVVLENEMEIILPPLLVNVGGPYLAVSALREDDFLLRFLDPEDGQIVFRANRFPVDWSADGQWLLFVEERQLRVAAPFYNFEWTIEHDLPGCQSAVWIEKTP